MMGSLNLVSNFQLKALFNSHNANIDAEKDNLEKHMGKWQGECDIFSKSLKKDDIYYDKNMKHACNIVLFSAHKPL
jgi:hypothetical protein